MLNGNPSPTLAVHKQSFDPYHVTPQPAFGLAWNPKGSDGWLGKIAGNGSMVVRAGYSLRRFTEPYQYYWNNASDQGAYYYQGFAYNGVVSGVQGTFTPGSLKLGDAAVTTPGQLCLCAGQLSGVGTAVGLHFPCMWSGLQPVPWRNRH